MVSIDCLGQAGSKPENSNAFNHENLKQMVSLEISGPAWLLAYCEWPALVPGRWARSPGGMRVRAFSEFPPGYALLGMALGPAALAVGWSLPHAPSGGISIPRASAFVRFQCHQRGLREFWFGSMSARPSGVLVVLLYSKDSPIRKTTYKKSPRTDSAGK